MSHKFKLLKGKIERGTLGSAAFDLFYSGVWYDRNGGVLGTGDCELGDRVCILGTGVYTEFSDGLMAVCNFEKSGLAAAGIEVKAGLIDSDYRDEWKVMLRNPMTLVERKNVFIGEVDGYANRLDMVEVAGWSPYVVRVGQKIGQFVLLEKPQIDYWWPTVGAELITRDVVRNGGFGSTGV